MNNTANSTNLKNFRKKKFFWRTLFVCFLLLPLLFLNKCGSFGCKGPEVPINDGVVTLDSVAADSVVASDSVAVEAPAPANVPASASVSAPESHESTVQSEAESPKQTEPTDTIVAPAEVVAPAGIIASADEPAPVSFTRADSVSGASAQKSKKAPVASADTAIIREPLPTDTTSTDTTSTDTTSTDTTSILPVASVPATASIDTTTIAEAATADTAIANATAKADTATAKADTATAVRVPFAPKKDVVALRTNLLYDAVLVPNIGIEVWLGKQFTLGADWFGTWLSSDKKHIYWQGYGGYLTLRYYFGKQAVERRFTGHHVGLYGSALTYDVEFGGKGYQAAKFGFGGGIEYGYSLQVHRCLAIDFNIGVGYQGGEYKTYQPTVDGTGHYVWLATYNRNWWGPTKAEISLKWLIAPVDKKKGGEQ